MDRRPSLIILIALALAFALTACAEDYASEQCRLQPEDCDGGAGAFCDNHNDCLDGLFCCTDDKNCGSGMCTAECRDDRDCPGGMLCEHDMCFYACDSDNDCAIGMKCQHGDTICEWD